MNEPQFHIVFSKYEAAILREELQNAPGRAITEREDMTCLAALVRFKDKLDVFLKRMTEAEYEQKNRMKFTDPIA